MTGDRREATSTDSIASRTRQLGAWLGLELSDGQVESLEMYGAWLSGEARGAGGIGPAEVPRIFDRHIGDSLVYHVGLPRRTGAIADIGSGVGLPGIPLGITHPDASVTLVDRSRRRVELARRAVRVLGLDNVDVVRSDVAQLDGHWPVVVFRASLPIAMAYTVLPDILEPGGIGLFGVSRGVDAPGVVPPPPGLRSHLLRGNPPMLDSPFWLLRMRGTSG